ncbi:hypothetical protein G7Z17_g20 [Cylindrodendrum hubeiense]|uniref:Polyketide synthase n=1 Tax=Cylindrodendrum hubeiense TaxID=595255 RepID=A0A9P5HQB8_9HYPO|nr:hypothetical protein G7Z17_g20 [Cylindrodendrum hubeiense]
MMQTTDSNLRSGMPATDDIAIVGYSFKLPQDVNDDSSFWEVLENRRNLMTTWPESRFTTDAFMNNNARKTPGLGGHFINENVGAFDAPFFSVTSKEAAAMDPMQRWTLEASYHAFEKAGMPAESLRGSPTAVFSASMLEDYARMTAMDPDNAERTAATSSTVSCVIPNRVSWYFDLRGPSIHVNTACSSSLSAVDIACKTLHSGDASCALVTGANLLLDPSIFEILYAQDFLSPDGVCHSFDHRANGYARGEGVIALVLKPISSAIRNGDMIRAVIRSTGSNQDGRTPVLTQPNPYSQEELIRHVYKRANLSLSETRYVEAHGTGTPVGDPIEMKAIGRVFREVRSHDEPLYVGSVKANFGHLEGASALVSIIKCILILEKGIIPPNALFEKINPAIDLDFYRAEIPTQNIIWPSSGLRRISLNSFGFGGSNTHIVLDDAFHYLQQRGFAGHHCTTPVAGLDKGHSTTNGISHANGKSHSDKGSKAAIQTSITFPKLLVWTAADEKVVGRVVQGYESFYKEKISRNPSSVDLLAHTLSTRRSHMLWRTFTIVDRSDGKEQMLSPARPIRSSNDVGLGFVFTGQGAQYVEMGWDLIQYPVFSQTLSHIDDIYRGLGCAWSIFDELCRDENINKPEYSQPLSTAIQIALVELLKSFGIIPAAVVGHSSGEIAAAYTIGALSLLSACKVSYFRGQLAGKLRTANLSSPGAMISINLAPDQVVEYLKSMEPQDISHSVCVACFNSPLNCTLSGPELAIDLIKVQADKDGIFAQKLNTGVAYHSLSMQTVAEEYLFLMGSLDDIDTHDLKIATEVPMVSSVSGQILHPATLTRGQYWVDNMVSPVQFSDAVQVLTQSKLKAGLGRITDLVEVGPHPALRRPVQDTIIQAGNLNTKVRYMTALNRAQPGIQTTLELVGKLFCYGHTVAISAVNQQSPDKPPPFLVNCPEYPFDRLNLFWSESRISRDFKLRGKVKGETLGMRVLDWNPLEPQWRNFLSIESTPWPWIKDHIITDTVLYPASGMLVMAIEAVQQMERADRTAAGYLVNKAEFISPIRVQETWEDRIETRVHLRHEKGQRGESRTSNLFQVTIFTYSRDQWNECFRASIQIDYQNSSEFNGENERLHYNQAVLSQYTEATEACRLPIDSRIFYRDAADHGLQYGDLFQMVQNVYWDGHTNAVARLDVSKARYQTSSLVHPAILDQAFHVLRVSAGQQPVANVPVRLTNAWFASSGWQTSKSVRWLATSTTSGANSSDGAGHGEHGSVFALADDGKVLCSIQKAMTSAVSKIATKKEKKLLYSIEWKPSLSLLDTEQLARACPTEDPTRDETSMMANHATLCASLDLAAARALKHMDRAKIPKSLHRHVKWMEHHVSKLSLSQREEGEKIGDEEFESRLHEIEKVLPAWKLYTTCARKLLQILAGEIDPLHVVFESDQADIFYTDLFQRLCADGRLEHIIDLLSHENPALRILEVGAGTGGMTGHLVTALLNREKRIGAPSFAEYSYTDISPAFFEKASSRWSELKEQGRISFKTLDLDQPIDSQGFEPASYDIVVAASVLHATPDLEATIRNVRKTLKPGGRLVLLEAINPDDIATNFMAGLVPGWWVAREDWRPHSAAVPEQLWDRCLKANGFSGNDLIMRDYESDECHTMSVIITTAVGEAQPANGPIRKHGRIVFVVEDQQLSHQLELAEAVRSRVDPDSNRLIRVSSFSLEQLSQTLQNLNENDIVICLAEVLNRPLLSRLPKTGFTCLQLLIKQAPNLLWVTATNPSNDQYPDYGVVQGFLRSIRAEQPENHIVTLAIEGEADITSCACFVTTVLHNVFDSQASKDIEYIVRDGLLMTGRAVEDVSGNNMLRPLLSKQLQSRAWAEGPALQLSVGSPGNLASLQFVQDTKYEISLAPNEVEIEAKAWGLSYHDVQAVMGHLDAHREPLGGDCAGIITRVGNACSSSIQPGDRVCMFASGCIRKYPRAHETAVFKMHDTVSMEAATSTLVPAMTAYYALAGVTRLAEGDKILIHSAAGSVGQMAIKIAQTQKVDIFATVSSPEEKQFLIEKLGICDTHIFYSQNTSWCPGVLRATRGDGVDVVLNTFSGENMLQASSECIARCGQFVDIGRENMGDDVVIPVSIITKNITFSVVSLVALSPRVMARLFNKTMQLLVEGKIQQPEPLHIFSASNVEQAFRKLQDDNRIGRAVITPKPNDVVPQFIQEHPTWTFDAATSYLIVGGSGGLGRAIVKWMVGRGAKHLILPSRSGAISKAAADMVAELTARGINIMAPKCDVSSEANLASVLNDCAHTMPPIKGCINAAMVLQDAVFKDSMTFAQWDLTLRSKVQTSWNLHRLLPQNLDFFILLSSLAGVAGQMASANYAGGCSFQDALARYRVAQGQPALSLDIGWMRNIGIIAENGAYQRQRDSADDMQPIEDTELLALLTIYCDPANQTLWSSRTEGQILLGLRTPVDILMQGKTPPALLDRPLFAAFSYIPGSGATKNDVSSNSRTGQVDHVAAAGVLFRKSTDTAERIQIVLRALAGKLARAMSISPDDVESHKPLSAYGVDSLMSVDLRNWIIREFAAIVSVFDIMDGVPIASIVELVVTRSRVGKVDSK